MSIRNVLNLPIWSAAAALMLMGCLTNTTHQEEPIPGILQSSYSYTSRHGQLIVQLPRRIEPFCSGNNLVIDTVLFRKDSTEYSLSGDTLEWDYRPDSSNTGAVVQHVLLYGRMGSGTGLPGLWKKGRSGYKVVSGQLALATKSTLDSLLTGENLEGAYYMVQLRVTGDSIEVYGQLNSAGLASVSWTNSTHMSSQADSLRWDMDFRIIDTHTAEYHGRKTGETVRVVGFDNYDVDYSSDNASHHPYHYSDKPETCPDEYEPEWYAIFKAANTKVQTSLPKAQIQPNSAKRGYQAPTPLKIRGFFLN